jgi:uncharacterized protein
MLIDTNIFLEVFLNQAKANDCLNFLEKVDRGELQGFVTDFTIHSIAVVLERAGRGDFMPQVFASLSSFQGLTLLHASLLEHLEIALLATQLGLDFDDAYQAFFAQRMKVPVISYDRHFNRVGERLEPVDFL